MIYNYFMMNTGHPLYHKFEKSGTTLEWHYARVVVSVLILNGSSKREMTLQEATELQTELLTEMKDELWL